MKLNEETVETILRATAIAKIFGIEQFIIEPHVIRGISGDKAAAIYTQCDIDIGCAAIGVNRIDLLMSRLALGIDNKIECIFDHESDDARMLSISSSKMRVEYRCAKVRTIQAPKELKVADLYRVDFSSELAPVINKAKTAMKAEDVSIMCSDNEVTYKIMDENNDKMLFEDGIADNIRSADAVNFIHTYPIKAIYQGLLKSSNSQYYITEKGMLHIVVNGIDLYLPAKQ
jgi:hypothetical protein